MTAVVQSKLPHSVVGSFGMASTPNFIDNKYLNPLGFFDL